MMALQQTAGTRPCIGSSVAARPSAARPQRLSQLTVRREVAVRGLKDDLIGRVNNPEESRENAERKEHDENSAWAKPKPNKNPLEKTGAAHGIGAGGAATADGKDGSSDIAEKAKAGVDNVVEGVKDAAKKATGNE
jgi:hypothetical protein